MRVKAVETYFLLFSVLTATLFAYTLISLPSVKAQQESSSKKRLFFYLHNDSSTPYINGYETFFIMNTSRRWSTAPATVRNLQTLFHYWYLYPTLASDYTVNGTVSLGMWINATGTSPSGTPTVTLYERYMNGTEEEVSSWNFGSTVLYNAPSYLNLTTPLITHTFKEGSSIRLYFRVVVGASTVAQLWFDTRAFDSRLVLESEDYMQVSSVKTYDVDGNETSVFSALWNETRRVVIIRANITDPLGGYDVYQVNISLIDPGLEVVMENHSMMKVAGTAFTYSNVYEANWTYSPSVVLGNYTIVVTAVDNSGFSYFSGASGVFGSYGNYVERAYGSFFIGTPFLVQIKTVDAHGRTLGDAYVGALSQDVNVDHGYTNSSGWWTATLYSGSYNITVHWQEVLVARTPIAVIEPANFTVQCEVYDPSFRVIDDVGDPLSKATVNILFPNGTVNILPMYTGENGFLNFTRMPAGNYTFTVMWKGVVVQKTSLQVFSDGPHTIECQVFQLTVEVEGADGSSIHGAYVWVYNEAGVPYDFGLTSAAGEAVFKLPVGTYRLEAFYSTAYLLTHVAANATKPSMLVDSSTSETLTLEGFPPPLWSTLLFWLVLAVAIVAVLVVAYLIYRWKR